MPGFKSVTHLATFLAASTLAIGAIASKATAHPIYEATGVQGGLVVHVGCGDGELTVTLRPNDRYLVHGLDTDAAAVDAARRRLHAARLYGPVSVAVFDGQRLPCAENLVNLLVVSQLGDLSQDEMLRVLCPGGVATIRQDDGTWRQVVKPRPETIDEWSHFMHDASGDAVSRDVEAGPPKRLRWVAEPRWCRSHEIPTSINAVVTAGGRLFTIIDEAPSGVYRKLPWKARLVARDAFSGVLLWKTSMRGWQPENGIGTGNRWNLHHTIPRRIVASADRVFVTLGFLDSPVSVLDAATGETLIDALPNSQGADELILVDNALIVKSTQGRSVAAMARLGQQSLNDTLSAFDATSGKPLWRRPGTSVLPYALSAAEGRAVYHSMQELICLDLRTGEEVWRADNPIASTVGGGSTLVIRDGVVLFHGHGNPKRPQPVKAKGKAKAKPAKYLTAFAFDDGRQLWQTPGSASLAGASTLPADVFVADGVVWCGNSLRGRDLKTGEVVQTLSIGQVISPGHHYRCHRARATERFLIWPKRGAEFLDLEGEAHMRHDWLRAPCLTGAMPANGLFYVPSNQCFCYPGVKLSGYLAMSAEPAAPLRPSGDAALQRGEATLEASAEAPSPGDWPSYRHDGHLSGATATAGPAELQQQWRVELACRGTQPVVVGDRLWIAEKDAHRVRCLSAATGDDLWSFTAGGRVDSSPTIHAGRAVFGCRDGHVYCLRATDGALLWRFRAAPTDRRVVSYGQLESAWPVHGSVLVHGDVVYFAAGRSSFLDGGILVYGLDVASGQVRFTHHLDGPWPDVQEDVGRPFAMEGALPDLIVTDGEHLFMQRIKFNAELNRLPTTRESDLGELDMGSSHLTATGGFLDDSGFDRVYWMHSKRWPGFYFAQESPKAGQLVVFDDRFTYAVKYFYRRIVWTPAFLPAEHGYLLFADDIDNEPILGERGQPNRAIAWLPKEAAGDKFRRGGRGVEKGTGYQRAKAARWQKMIPLRVRAMALAGDTLFTAGTPDVLDPADPLAAFEGRAGASVQVFAAADGKQIAHRDLPAPPVFDGLSIAHGRLYVALDDGTLLCLGDE